MLPSSSLSLLSALIFLFSSLSYPIYLPFSLFLPLALVYMHIHICTCVCMRINRYIPCFFLFSVFLLSPSLSVDVSILLHHTLEYAHRARSRYIRQSAHMRPRRVHAGVGHVRDALFARRATFAFYASRARAPVSELYALFSDLLRRAFRYTPLNKGDTKTAR